MFERDKEGDEKIHGYNLSDGTTTTIYSNKKSFSGVAAYGKIKNSL